jgi:hypothetical protein
MQMLIRKVSHSRFPLGYTVTLETKTNIFTAVRHEDGEQRIGFYNDKAVAVREQSQWYNDECISRERAAAKADAERIYKAMGYASHHLGGSPEQCRCGDCLTYMAGQ